MMIITWIKTNWMVIVPCAIALIDLAFALSPGLKSNGILHSVYLWLRKDPPALS